MKINTDGVLLGALAQANNATSILDIGTGTGVIALMLAQRFSNAEIDAVEIDVVAARTAEKNFKNSPFRERLNLYPVGFEAYFESYPERKYDLIISNPPFYINSLTADDDKVNLAKHAGPDFFRELVETVASQLTDNGNFWLILPLETSALVKDLAMRNGLFVQKAISVYSFTDSEAHRQMISFSRKQTNISQSSFVIYDAPKIYSEQYRQCLIDFFTIF